MSLVMDLCLRRLLLDGFTQLTALGRALHLSQHIVEAAFRHMRQQQLIEVKGMQGNDYTFSLSGAGRLLAAERCQITQYAGPAPVSLDHYCAATKAQSANVQIDQHALRLAFSDLVVPDGLLDQLGPAIISQNSIFLYGPTGNGKTSLAERMSRVYDDTVMIPYAVEVDGQIIMLYDPVVHEHVDVDEGEDIDPRWIRCRRPCIVVGGELVQNMLELRFDKASHIYASPLQMKANNGILLIDDFGRQLISPRDLLNRWIVPLDRRVDYLSLQYGVKFQIPFELMVVFSTNLDPRDLADEAFLRRIHNKVYVEAVNSQTFDRIFHRVVAAKEIEAESGSAEFLRSLCLQDGRSELRACLPSDICNILMSISKYEGREVYMNKPDLERAAALYFARV